MDADSVEDSEISFITSEKESDDTNNQVSENEIKVKLLELKVADLRTELEKRSLDKSGVKSVLIERLKAALLEEGKDVDECTFKIPNDNIAAKSVPKKDILPDSETNGNMEISDEIDQKADEIEDSDIAMEVLTSNEITNSTTEKKTLSEITNTTIEDETFNKGTNSTMEDKTSNEVTDSAIEDITSNEVTDSTMEDKTSNEVTLQISIDEEEAQLNDDETLELNKGSDIETDKVIEDSNASNFESTEEKNKSPNQEKLVAIQTTPSKSKVSIDELKEKKLTKTPHIKTEVATNLSPKVLKVIGKNDKIKSANVLAKSLWVTGLPNTTRAAELKIMFSKHGKVSSVKIVKSTKQNPPKCYAFVTMVTSKDATKAIQNLHRIEFNGRIISVERTQSDPSALLKRTESKVASLASKKTAVKKDTPKVVDSTKPTSEPKPSSKPEIKSNELKRPSEAAKPKESKTKSTEKLKSKEKDHKATKEHKDRDVRHEPVKRNYPPAYKARSFTFNNDRRRYQTVRRPFNSRPFRGRSRFGTTNFRPRSDISLYEKMREERIRRERFRERERREADRRREYIERKQREEAYRLEREKEKLRIEREMLEREKAEMLKIEREKQRLERERLEREREELRRQTELRRGVKRPYNRTREVNSFWEDRKKVPRYEERSSFHGEKIRIQPSSSSKYDYLPRERSSLNRHEYNRHSERFGSSKALHTPPRTDFGDRDSRREVTIRSREENPVYVRNEFRDRDSRRSFLTRERQSTSRREGAREDWKHERRVHERLVSPSTSSGQRRMTYY